MKMRRERGDIDLVQEPESFKEELRIQLCMFSEWLENKGYSQPLIGETPMATHTDLVESFMDGSGRDTD